MNVSHKWQLWVCWWDTPWRTLGFYDTAEEAATALRAEKNVQDYELLLVESFIL